MFSGTPAAVWFRMDTGGSMATAHTNGISKEGRPPYLPGNKQSPLAMLSHQKTKSALPPIHEDRELSIALKRPGDENSQCSTFVLDIQLQLAGRRFCAVERRVPCVRPLRPAFNSAAVNHTTKRLRPGVCAALSGVSG